MARRLLLCLWLGAAQCAAAEEATRFLQARALKTQSDPSSPSSRNAGALQLWLSDAALTYISQELLPQVLRNLTKVSLGSFSGDYKGVKYRLWDVDLNHVGIQRPRMDFEKDQGVRLCLGGIWANVSSDWSAEWYFLSLQGGTSVLVTDGQLCATIGLKTVAGRPKVNVDQLDVSLELGPVTFTGTSIHWLMNAAAFFFESYLEDLAAKTIKSNVQSVVKKNLAESLQSLDLSTSISLPEVNETVSVDLSLQSIQTGRDYLQVDVNGLPSVSGMRCPLPRESQTYSNLPSAWHSHMASGTLSNWGISCGIWAVNKTGLLNYKMLPWFIPNNTLGISLYTSFMSLLVPGLKTHYHRDYPLELSIAPLPTPSFKFEAGYLYLVSPILFNFTTLLTKSGKREFCFSFMADVHAHGHLWIEQKPMRLKTNITLLGATDVRAGGSIAGPINLHYADQLLQVLRGPGEQALNDGPLKPAIPLSSNSSFSLKDVELNISKGGIYFFSDLAVRFGREVQEMISRQFKP